MPDTSVWRSRPIFITSTFRDMHAERDYLHTHVFPELEERLRQRRCYLEPIDLRWGVETGDAAEEQAKQLQILKVCLVEVERSRPFLIGLLGDRYGWVPPTDRIEAAAQEAGFDRPVAGRSITDLEIDYGVLASPDQRRRCFFYLRERLPYDRMPPALAAQYDEAHNPEPGAPKAVKKLAVLKQRLWTELPDRVRTYTAEWDTEKQRITRLDSWGQQVLADLWRELDAETTELALAEPSTWQQQERLALEQFIQERTRDFIGRKDILRNLLAVATGEGTLFAECYEVCVVSPPGFGKSALFGELYRSLQRENLILLAHAAGITPRSTQVDAMLRRWIEELASALGQPDPLAETVTPNELRQMFHGLLERANRVQRVVILLDALDQLEPTNPLSWLPQYCCPPNARLIATTLPGQSALALTGRGGTENRVLPLLSQNDATAIAQAICRRYHRALHPQILECLLSKHRADGERAVGNPLWLTLAMEELNLLDADDFARADREFTGPPEERLHQLLCYTIAQMPTEVEGLYGWMLDRTEQLFGRSFAQAFVNLIALGRGGWRESDLRVLMAQVSGQLWDGLTFAALRRTFRAHVVQRGLQGQWAFAHTQLQEEVTHRTLADPATVRALHRTLADHLIALPREDPLHETELIVHLIRAEDHLRAARYYGSVLTQGEAAGATQSLADLILADVETEPNPGLILVLLLLHQEALHDSERGRLCHRFVFDLEESLRYRVLYGTLIGLLGAAKSTLERLVAQDPRNTTWQEDLSVSHLKIGNALEQGDLAGALREYRASEQISERLVAQDPRNTTWQEDLSISHLRIGDILWSQGDLAGALNAYRASLVIDELLVRQDPGNTTWQQDLGRIHGRLGSVLRLQGDLAGAIKAYQASYQIFERLAAQDPRDADWNLDLLALCSWLADTFDQQGDEKNAASWHQRRTHTFQLLKQAGFFVGPPPHLLKWSFPLRLQE